MTLVLRWVEGGAHFKMAYCGARFPSFMVNFFPDNRVEDLKLNKTAVTNRLFG